MDLTSITNPVYYYSILIYSHINKILKWNTHWVQINNNKITTTGCRFDGPSSVSFSSVDLVDYIS